MDAKISKLGDELMALTTAEALELQKYLESKGLVVVQAVATTAATTVVEEEEVESANVNVVVTKKGSLIQLAKALMPKTGKTAVELKKLTDALPAIVMATIPRAEGVAMLSELANEISLEEHGIILQDA